MKNIKLMLLGIALICTSGYTNMCLTNGGDQDVFTSIIVGAGVFLPLIGLVLCLIAFFSKDKNDKESQKLWIRIRLL